MKNLQALTQLEESLERRAQSNNAILTAEAQKHLENWSKSSTDLLIQKLDSIEKNAQHEAQGFKTKALIWSAGAGFLLAMLLSVIVWLVLARFYEPILLEKKEVIRYNNETFIQTKGKLRMLGNQQYLKIK